MELVLLLLLTAMPIGSFALVDKHGDELPPGSRVVEELEENISSDAWQSFVNNLPYLSYSNDSKSPSFVWFEEISHSLVRDIINFNFKESYYQHKIGRNIKLQYHHFKKLSKISDQYLTFWTANETLQSSSVVKILGSTITNITQNNFAVVLLATFKQSSLSEKTHNNKNFNKPCLSSDVISVSLFKGNSKKELIKESIPVQFEVEVNQINSGCFTSDNKNIILLSKPTYSCEYFDDNLNAWSGVGCSISPQSLSPLSRRRCTCNHTTSFAVILSLNEIKIPSALEITIQVVETISAVMLLLTIIVIVLFRRFLEPDRFTTQLGIATSLLFLHLFFLIGSLAVTENLGTLCVFITVMCHLCTISSAMWMLNEAVMLVLKIRRTCLRFQGKTHKVQLLISGCLLPVIYVTICATVGFATNTYIDIIKRDRNSSNVAQYDRCWLSSKYNMTLAVIIPLSIVFTINFVILIATVRVVRKMDRFVRTSKPQRKDCANEWKLHRSQFTSTLRASIMLFPVLGIPWILGFFVNIPGAEIEFIAIHGIVNGLQGLFVFLIFCFKNNKLREATKKKIVDLTAGLSAHNPSKKAEDVFRPKDF